MSQYLAACTLKQLTPNFPLAILAIHIGQRSIPETCFQMLGGLDRIRESLTKKLFTQERTFHGWTLCPLCFIFGHGNYEDQRSNIDRTEKNQWIQGALLITNEKNKYIYIYIRSDWYSLKYVKHGIQSQREFPESIMMHRDASCSFAKLSTFTSFNSKTQSLKNLNKNTVWKELGPGMIHEELWNFTSLTHLFFTCWTSFYNAPNLKTRFGNQKKKTVNFHKVNISWWIAGYFLNRTYRFNGSQVKWNIPTHQSTVLCSSIQTLRSVGEVSICFLKWHQNIGTWYQRYEHVTKMSPTIKPKHEVFSVRFGVIFACFSWQCWHLHQLNSNLIDLSFVDLLDSKCWIPFVSKQMESTLNW